MGETPVLSEAPPLAEAGDLPVAEAATADVQPEAVTPVLEDEAGLATGTLLQDQQGQTWKYLGKTETGMQKIESPDESQVKFITEENFAALRPAGQPEESPAPEPQPELAEPTIESETSTDGDDEKSEQETSPEAYEKLMDKNIDPRVILALKQKVEEKFRAGGQLDASTKKVMGIREVTRHLLAQGVAIDQDGDFMPEGMQLLHAMSTMLDMPDWALQRLKSERVGDEPPLLVELDDQALVDFIKQTNEENIKNLPKRDERQAVAGETAEDKEPAVNTKERLEFIGRLIAHRTYARARWVKKDIDKAINSGHKYLDSTLDRVIESLNSDDINKRRRSALGWLAGAFATAGSAYAGVDRELLSNPSLTQYDNEASDFFQPVQPPEAEETPVTEFKIDEPTRNLLGRAGILSSDEFANQETGKKYHIVESDPHYEQFPGLILLEDGEGKLISTDYDSLIAQLKNGSLSIGRVRQVGPITGGLS
jgi:hypothetical protein